MPMLFHCHECDQPTSNRIGLCHNCIEQSNTDEDKYFDKDDNCTFYNNETVWSGGGGIFGKDSDILIVKVDKQPPYFVLDEETMRLLLEKDDS